MNLIIFLIICQAYLGTDCYIIELPPNWIMEPLNTTRKMHLNFQSESGM